MSDNSKWSSKIGFILASAGSAIGLGAVWKFPYMTAANGGGGFLLVFLIFTLLIGLPLLLAEFVLGRGAGVSAIRTFGKLGKNKKYNVIGYIGGWILVYLGISIADALGIHATTDHATLFTSIISNTWIALGAQALFILLNIYIVSRGVQKGIEKASKIMMPLLFIIFLVIIARSLTLPNALSGVTYFLKPAFTKLTSSGILFALGQSFFALSIGVTAMLTYASYLDRRTNLVQSGISVVLMNIAVSVMAGLAIFPAMSSFGMESEGGPSLLFIVLPQLFNNMAFGKIFYILFLILFLFATITSSVVMLEINVGNITNQRNTNRTKFSIIIGILTFIVGIPSALSYGSLSNTLIFGKTVFDLMDFLVSNILMPLGCLALSIFTGYVLDKKVALEQLHIDKNKKSSLALFKVWLFLLRYVLPIIILIVCLAQFL